jgi:hypothetical protein
MAMIPPPGADDLDQPGLSRLGTMAEPVEAPPDSSSPLSAAKPRSMLRRGWEVLADVSYAVLDPRVRYS